MAITVTGSNPTVITVVSTTITTDTIFGTNPPNDRTYFPPDNIIGVINPGVGVGGFGLSLLAANFNRGIDFTNNGFVDIDQGNDALLLAGNGGPMIYRGTGSVTNAGSGDALDISGLAGTVDVTIDGNLTSNG